MKNLGWLSDKMVNLSFCDRDDPTFRRSQNPYLQIINNNSGSETASCPDTYSCKGGTEATIHGQG